MQNFLKSKIFKIIFTSVACLFGIMAFEISTGQPIFLENFLNMTARPCTKFILNTHNRVLDFFNSFFKSGIYKEENELLKEEVASLRKKVTEFTNIKNENDQLKQALNIQKTNKTFKVEIASFVGRDPNDFSGFEIDAGKNKGISAGDVVLTKNGLVGTITKVANFVSNVASILDAGVQIPAVNVDSESEEKGVICGQIDLAKEGFCIMDHLNKSNKCKAGDMISTFGNSNYPENIPIGRIKEIRVNKNGMSCFAIIEPFENAMRVKDVVVIKRSS